MFTDSAGLCSRQKVGECLNLECDDRQGKLKSRIPICRNLLLQLKHLSKFGGNPRPLLLNWFHHGDDKLSCGFDFRRLFLAEKTHDAFLDFDALTIEYTDQ